MPSPSGTFEGSATGSGSPSTESEVLLSLFCNKSKGADDDISVLLGTGAVVIPSQRPRIDSSRVSVALIARSVVLNSWAVIRDETILRTRRAATCPACGARGDGPEEFWDVEDSACETVEIPRVKNPVMAPDTHS